MMSFLTQSISNLKQEDRTWQTSTPKISWHRASLKYSSTKQISKTSKEAVKLKTIQPLRWRWSAKIKDAWRQESEKRNCSNICQRQFHRGSLLLTMLFKFKSPTLLFVLIVCYWSPSTCRLAWMARTLTMYSWEIRVSSRCWSAWDRVRNCWRISYRQKHNKLLHKQTPQRLRV